MKSIEWEITRIYWFSLGQQSYSQYTRTVLCRSCGCRLHLLAMFLTEHALLYLRKPAFCICENKGADQIRGSALDFAR